MVPDKKSSPTRPSAILFDIDDTLYDQICPFAWGVHHALPHITGIDMAELFKARGRHGEYSFRKVLSQEMTMEEMYRYRIQKSLRDFDIEISDSEADAFQQAYEEGQNHLEMSPEMEELLTYCHKKNIKLGIITNGPAEHQRKKADNLQVKRFMLHDHVIVSGEIGITKPDLRIFRLAESRMNLDPETTWYVGDSFENDIAGAAGAGWHTIWLNRRGKPLPEGAASPDLCVPNDGELLRAVKGMFGDD